MFRFFALGSARSVAGETCEGVKEFSFDSIGHLSLRALHTAAGMILCANLLLNGYCPGFSSLGLQYFQNA